MAKTTAADALPRPLGRYELLYEIASGGMATVYLARACGVAGFERLVAIKCCHAHLRREQEFAEMFLDEARLAARIHHPNVVATLDVGEADDGSLFLVMDMVDGFSLSRLQSHLRRENRVMPVPIALRIMIDALSGLHAAHELRDASGKPLNLVHRDVSPQNVLVGADGATRITDFGVAKAEERLSVTREGHLKGKLSYMAPEQLALNPTLSRQADLYAAGVVLWEVLTGQRLFDGRSDVETMNLVLRASVRPPSEVVPEIPPELDAVVARALQREASRRFASALEFAEALENTAVRPAGARAVGAYVQETLAEGFAKRHELMRTCLEMAPLAIEWPTSKGPTITLESDRPPPPSYVTKPMGRARRMRKTMRTRLPAAVATILLATGAWAWVARRPSHASTPTSATVQPARFADPARNEVPPPSAPPPVIVRTLPVEAVDASTTQSAAVADAPDAAAPTTAHRHHHHAPASVVAGPPHESPPARFMPSAI